MKYKVLFTKKRLNVKKNKMNINMQRLKLK